VGFYRFQAKTRFEKRLLTVLFFCGALLFGTLAILHERMIHDARALAREGVQTTATVSRLSTGGRRSTHYYLEYQYPVGGTKYTTGHRETTAEEYAELHEGMRIPVRFDPDDPIRSVTPQELASLERWGGRIGFFLYSLGLLAAFASRAWPRPKAKPKPKPKATSARKPRGNR
jgi:Protein of unknown function (DUF3592)